MQSINGILTLFSIPTSIAAGCLLAFACSLAPKAVAADELSFQRIDQLLSRGELQRAEKELTAWLTDHPEDSSRRLALGVVQLAGAYQSTFIELNKHGAKFHLRTAGLEETKRPKKAPVVDYKVARRLIRSFRGRIANAQRTITKSSMPDARFPVHLAAIQIDLDGDGVIEKGENIAAITRYGKSTKRYEEDLFVLDQADALWFDAQCHAILAACNFLLAYDWSETYQYTGHALFWNTGSPFNDKLGEWRSNSSIEDGIALIHLMRWPLHNKKRMLDSLHHSEQFVEKMLSVLESLEKEKDNDHELLAGPHQDATIGSFRIREKELQEIKQVALHARQLLKGKKLAPRIVDSVRYTFSGDKRKITSGINVRRFFTEPRRFDLVMLLQGLGARPYIEEGEVEMDLWRNFNASNLMYQFRLFGLP